MSFNSSPSFLSRTIADLRRDAHSLTTQEIPKGTKSARHQKRQLVSTISSLVDQIDTDDFGIRVIIAKAGK